MAGLPYAYSKSHTPGCIQWSGDIILWLRSVATAWDNSLGENTTRLEFENMIRLLPLSISAGSGNVQIKFAKYTYKFYRVHVTLAC